MAYKLNMESRKNLLVILGRRWALIFLNITGKADVGAPFLLDSIVAVVIGGASLYGGI